MIRGKQSAARKAEGYPGRRKAPKAKARPNPVTRTEQQIASNVPKLSGDMPAVWTRGVT